MYFSSFTRNYFKFYNRLIYFKFLKIIEVKKLISQKILSELKMISFFKFRGKKYVVNFLNKEI